MYILQVCSMCEVCCCLQDISQEIQLFPRETYEGLEFEFIPGEGCNRCGILLLVTCIYIVRC